jgi:hypothetical protein
MGAEFQKEYSKGELVELISGVACNKGLDWIDVAQKQQVTIEESDMREIFNAVMSYKENRLRNYGPNGEYTKYFMPDFIAIEKAFRSGDLTAFRQACAGLLRSIGWD